MILFPAWTVAAWRSSVRPGLRSISGSRLARRPSQSPLKPLAAAELNAAYLKRVATGLPYITAKWAMTLDGKTAVASGDSQWISSPGSRSLVHQLRGRMDAILVGIGTVLADDPQLTARPAGPRTAARIVLDSKALLPLNSRLVQTAREVPVLVAVSRQAPADRRHALEARGCEVVVFPGETRVPIMALLAELGQRAVTNLLVEGGGRVLGSFLEAGQVDEVEAYIAPILEGGDHPAAPRPVARDYSAWATPHDSRMWRTARSTVT